MGVHKGSIGGRAGPIPSIRASQRVKEGPRVKEDQRGSKRVKDGQNRSTRVLEVLIVEGKRFPITMQSSGPSTRLWVFTTSTSVRAVLTCGFVALFVCCFL